MADKRCADFVFGLQIIEGDFLPGGDGLQRLHLFSVPMGVGRTGMVDVTQRRLRLVVFVGVPDAEACRSCQFAPVKKGDDLAWSKSPSGFDSQTFRVKGGDFQIHRDLFRGCGQRFHKKRESVWQGGKNQGWPTGRDSFIKKSMNLGYNKQQHGGVLKVVLITGGVLFLLIIVAVIGAGWYGKKKLDEAGGIQGFATQMMAKGIDALKPELEKVLPAEDVQRLNEDLATLKEQASKLSPEQIEAVANALQKVADKMKQGAVTEADAKTFVDELSAALKQTPAPAVE